MALEIQNRRGSGEILKDKYHIVSIIFVLHGIGAVMPWNMFLNANDYFTNSKFKTNDTGIAGSYYEKQYYQHLSAASMLPLVISLWLNVFLTARDEHFDTKVTVCLSFDILLLLVTIILTMVDTSTWTNIFFGLTMFTVVLLNIFNGFYQGIICGLASRLSWRYLGCLAWGNNLSGTFTTLVAILATFINASIRTKALYYFIIAMIILLLCLNTYLALPLIKYYRILECLRQRKVQQQRRRRRRTAQARVPFLFIFKETFPQLLNVFLVFVVTMALFPTVQMNIQPIDENFFLGPDLFVLVVCFFTFNFFAAIGSLLALCFQWPTDGLLIMPVALRFLYIPFYLFCNYRVRGAVRKLPVLIANDWAYWAVSATMAFTSGYWSTVALEYIPGLVATQYRYVAGTLSIAILITGVVVGILTTYIWLTVI